MVCCVAVRLKAAELLFVLSAFGLLFMSDDGGVKVDRDYLGDTLGRFNVDFYLTMIIR